MKKVKTISFTEIIIVLDEYSLNTRLYFQRHPESRRRADLPAGWLVSESAGNKKIRDSAPKASLRENKFGMLETAFCV